MKTKAAVLEKIGAPLTIRTLTVPKLGRGQVLVRLMAAGICHSQISEIDGERGPDAYLPHLLGHEAAGVIAAVGPGVKKVAVGNTVVLTWIQGKGLSAGGVKYASEAGDVNAGAIAVFTEYAVISENRVVPIPATIDPAIAALFGCAVPTGVGAVMNTLQVRPESTIAVFGVGGVGLCSIMAAKIARARDTIAVDVLPKKLTAAKAAGATNVINATKKGAVKEIQRRYPRGIDYAVAATGVPRVIEQAFAVISDEGKVAVVGHPAHGQTIRIEPHALIRGRQIIGSWGGDVKPDRDIPRYLKWYANGQLPAGQLVTKKYSLGRINQAIDDLKRGRILRPIIIF